MTEKDDGSSRESDEIKIHRKSPIQLPLRCLLLYYQDPNVLTVSACQGDGRQSKLAPTASLSARICWPRCAGRLSLATTSPGRWVYISTCSK
jgi:hypothetical protein